MLALLCAGGFWYMHTRAPAEDTSTEQERVQILADGFAAGAGVQQSVTVSNAPRTPPQGMKEYRNERYRISLLYPEDLSVKEYKQDYGAMTIAFENKTTVKGFQIFVTPYNEPVVTKGRFRRDAPSGVMEMPVENLVGGAAATGFYGRDQILGETAELWFIHDGLLYEASTPKPDAAWFASIMETWQFVY